MGKLVVKGKSVYEIDEESMQRFTKHKKRKTQEKSGKKNEKKG